MLFTILNFLAPTLYEAEVKVKSCEEEIFRKSIARKMKGQKTLDMMS